MKKLIIVILFFIAAVSFSENTKNFFNANTTWILDDGNKDYKIIFKGNVAKDIIVDDAEHNPPDVLSGATISYKNIVIESDKLISIIKSNAGYDFLDSLQAPSQTVLDDDFKDAGFIQISPASGDFNAFIPMKEFKKIKTFKLSKTKTAIQYNDMTFIFPNGTYSIKAVNRENPEQ